MPNSCVRSNSAVSRTRSPGSAGAEAVSGRLDTWARLLQAIMRLYSREGGSPSPVGSEFDGRRWAPAVARSEEHTSDLQSPMRISYAVLCLKKKRYTAKHTDTTN